MRSALALTLLLTACGSEDFSLLSESVSQGMLLSGWSDGETLHIVGGDLDGGAGVRVTWDGKRLCTEPEVTERALWWITGEGSETFAVGEAGTILHTVDGVETREDVDTEATLFGVWMDGDRAWAVGGEVGGGANRGEIWTRENGEWTAIDTDVPGVLFKMWDGFVVGDGVAYTLEDDLLVPVDAGGERLLTVRGRSGTDVWAVGGLADSVVMHSDGGDFEAVDSTGLNGGLNGVWTGPDEDVWVAGHFGTMARQTDDGWASPSPPLTSEHFHAVVQHQDEMFWLGGNLFSAGDNFGVIGRYGKGTPKPRDCD
ncbi:MAG: hypothetical protein KC912_13750 [Proteobacteria bacterium]|nr:hypothetical protein [Pseudomonadota bacterium]